MAIYQNIHLSRRFLQSAATISPAASSLAIGQWTQRLSLFDDPILGNNLGAARQRKLLELPGTTIAPPEHCWPQGGKEVIDQRT